eukprot:SM000026S09003  [mRNA]  locus=s26:973359:975143:- [translate_table: standard]
MAAPPGGGWSGDNLVVAVTEDAEAGAELVRYALASLYHPGSSLYLLHIVTSLPNPDGSRQVVSQVNGLELSQHLLSVVTPLMEKYKAMCDPYKVTVRVRVAKNDCEGKGITKAANSLGATSLILSQSPSRFLRRPGQTVEYCASNRSPKCSLHVLQKGKVVLQEGVIERNALPVALTANVQSSSSVSDHWRLRRSLPEALSFSKRQALGSLTGIFRPSETNFSLGNSTSCSSSVSDASSCATTSSPSLSPQHLSAPGSGSLSVFSPGSDHSLAPPRRIPSPVSAWSLFLRSRSPGGQAHGGGSSSANTQGLGEARRLSFEDDDMGGDLRILDELEAAEEALIIQTLQTSIEKRSQIVSESLAKAQDPSPKRVYE